jgi:hypothetical protein
MTENFYGEKFLNPSIQNTFLNTLQVREKHFTCCYPIEGVAITALQPCQAIEFL